MKRILLSERIKKAPGFLTIEPYLRPQDKPVPSDPEAREPRLVPLVVIDYGSFAARIRQMRFTLLREPWPMAGRLSSTIPNAPCLFQTIMAVRCVSNTAHLVTPATRN